MRVKQPEPFDKDREYKIGEIPASTPEDVRKIPGNLFWAWNDANSMRHVCNQIQGLQRTYNGTVSKVGAERPQTH
jgi:hypothetical protein